MLVILIVIETTDRPFATSILSRRTFITAKEQGDRKDTFDLSISRQGVHPPEDVTENKKGARNTVVEVQRESFDRSRINTPESSGGGSPDGQSNAPSWMDRSSRIEQRRSTRRDTMRVRSQAVPTPLETIFGSRETLPDPRNSPGIKGDFSWRPPTRDSEYNQRPMTSDSFRDTLQPRSNAASTVFSNMSALPPPLATNPVPAPRASSTFGPADTQAIRQSVARPRSSSVPPEAQSKPPVQRRPTLPNLTDLPARAAARRRNSLIAREADLDPRASTEISRRFSLIGQNNAPPSPRNDFVEVPIPDIKPRELETDEDGIIPVESHPLARNNTTRGRLVRNFSRPRRRSTMVGPVDVVMDGDKARRTSSFLPEPARERGRERRQGGANMEDDRRAEVRRSKSVPPVASNTAARTKRVSLILDEPRSKPPTARLPRKPVAGPRFSPFPATGNGAPDQRRLKGLGQGSARRLDKEVSRWVEGVQAEPRTSSDAEAPPSIISDVSTDILDPETVAPFRRSGTGKLSREDSVSGRTRRIAQNF